MSLELMALRWLLYEKRCEIALRERSPRQWQCGEPDVMGITKSRHMIEVEVKRSVSDFKRDFTKRSREDKYREFWRFKLPRNFYYLVPAHLVFKIEPMVPKWAGLLRGPTSEEPQGLFVVKKAPVNTDSERLTVKECCRLVRMMANWAMTEAQGHFNAYRNFRDGHSVWPEPDYEI